MDKSQLEKLLNYLSPKLREHIRKISPNVLNIAEEIRITKGKHPIICYNNGYIYNFYEIDSIICNDEVINETLMLITGNSIYAANDKLTKGYFTLKGGYRVGVCGSVVTNQNTIYTIKEFSSVNIRIPREIIGVASNIITHISNGEKIKNTLLISPPQCGKTTLLRDIARLLGNKYKVSIIDERSEIAAMNNGVPQNDVGKYTTVIDCVSKSYGIPMIIRNMSPQVIITDEINPAEDENAIEYAATSGVKIITSAHGKDINDIRHNKIKNIIDYFDLFIILTNRGRTGHISQIIGRDEFDY